MLQKVKLEFFIGKGLDGYKGDLPTLSDAFASFEMMGDAGMAVDDQLINNIVSAMRDSYSCDVVHARVSYEILNLDEH